MIAVQRTRQLGANHQQRASPDGHAQRFRRNAGHVDDDLHGGRGFEYIERRPAFGVDGRQARHIAIELDQQPSRIVGEIGSFLVEQVGHRSDHR